MDINLLIMITSIIGTLAFSISGALIAIECKLDIFGVIISGCTTACGGGILRDIMLNRPIAMFKEPMYVLISLVISVLVFIIVYLLKNDYFTHSKIYKNFLIITDSIGLGAFVVVGANASVDANAITIFEICFYGVLTAVGGGLIRDIMVNKIPVILRKHIYAVAAIIGSIIYYIMYINNLYNVLAFSITVVLIVLIRYLAYYFELSLPKVNIVDKAK